MSLADELAAAKNQHRVGPRCGIALLLEQLDEDDAAALADAIDDQANAGTLIASVLNSRGYDIGAEAVRRHRRRSSGNGCSCPKDEQ